MTHQTALGLALVLLAAPPDAPLEGATRPKEPWTELASGCWGDGSQWREVYEVGDPKDPTVNLRADEGGAVLAELPNRSLVLLAQDAPVTTWSSVLAVVRLPAVQGWLKKSELMHDRLRAGAWIVVPNTGPGRLLERPEAASRPLLEEYALSVTILTESGEWAQVVADRRRKEVEGVVHKSRLKKVKTAPIDPACASEVSP